MSRGCYMHRDAFELTHRNVTDMPAYQSVDAKVRWCNRDEIEDPMSNDDSECGWNRQELVER